MLLSQEPVNLYMTFALISFGVTSLSEKSCPILKDLNTTLVFTFKSFPILHLFFFKLSDTCPKYGATNTTYSFSSSTFSPRFSLNFLSGNLFRHLSKIPLDNHFS